MQRTRRFGTNIINPSPKVNDTLPNQVTKGPWSLASSRAWGPVAGRAGGARWKADQDFWSTETLFVLPEGNRRLNPSGYLSGSASSISTTCLLRSTSLITTGL